MLIGNALAPLLGFANVGGIQSTDEIYYLLVVQNIGMFLLPAYLATRLVHRHALTRLGLAHKAKILSSLFVVGLAVSILPFISFTAALNALVPFPDWIVAMEKSAADLTNQLLFTDQWEYFGLNLLVMAAMPALVEEIFFRGFLQNLVHRWTKNAHWAIFVTALIFSAFHLQFISFLPRLLLGIILGYLFYWSGSLWLSVIAHFVNNAMGICVYFYVKYNQLPFNPDAIDAAMQSNTLIAIASAVTAGLLLNCIFQVERTKIKR
ncbi:hypothetical protein FACS189467_0490 [Bacteroidia bacterium]|nr:hypothetical protein FACS189467_0490 [Bacteroidia bacterium]